MPRSAFVRSARWESSPSRTLTIEVESARELQALLMPGSDLATRGACYRGHGDADWKLTPSLVRAPKELRLTEEALAWGSREGIALEAAYLSSFIEACNVQGLPIPGTANGLGDSIVHFERAADFAGVVVSPADSWPPAEAVGALALAQHYGVPTRLLDWTSNPFIGAYFAAAESARLQVLGGIGQPSYFAVWIYDAIRMHEYNDGQTYVNSLPRLFIPIYAENPNIRAQAGIMMYETSALNREPQPITELDRAISNSLDRATLRSPALFLKLVVPASEAFPLMEDLALMGVSATSLFPGYYGAAREVLGSIASANALGSASDARPGPAFIASTRLEEIWSLIGDTIFYPPESDSA